MVVASGVLAGEPRGSPAELLAINHEFFFAPIPTGIPGRSFMAAFPPVPTQASDDSRHPLTIPGIPRRKEQA